MEFSSEEVEVEQPEKIEEEGHGLPRVFRQLEGKLGNDEESLLTKVQRIFFSTYSEAQKEQLYELLEQWKDFELQDLIDNEEITGESVQHFYKQVEILSARVYSKTINYIKSILKNYAAETKPLREFLNDQELTFSYDRFFWKRKTFKSNAYSYGSFGVKYQQAQELKTGSAQANKFAEFVADCDIPLLKSLLKFMLDIEIITLGDNKESHNVFVSKLERITKEEQKLLYFSSMEFVALEDIRTLHNKSFKRANEQEDIRANLKRNYANYYLYKEETIKGQKIERLHEKFQNYRFLEDRHDYIQWMFPNHYGSKFNSSSFPLDYIETRLFRDDEHIGLRMLVSIYVFFDFMGIRLNINTFSLTLCDERRLKDVILVNFHNHLRIMRIFACLSVIGFRGIAMSLLGFIDKYTSEGMLLERERREFQNSWGIYGEQSPGVPFTTAKHMCFLEDDKFPEYHSVLAKLQDPQQPIQPLLEQTEKVMLPESQQPIQSQDSSKHKHIQDGEF